MIPRGEARDRFDIALRHLRETNSDHAYIAEDELVVLRLYSAPLSARREYDLAWGNAELWGLGAVSNMPHGHVKLVQVHNTKQDETFCEEIDIHDFRVADDAEEAAVPFDFGPFDSLAPLRIAVEPVAGADGSAPFELIIISTRRIAEVKSVMSQIEPDPNEPEPETPAEPETPPTEPTDPTPADPDAPTEPERPAIEPEPESADEREAV